MKKNSKICLFSIFISLFHLTSCELFNTSLNDYLEEYTEKAAIEIMKTSCEIRTDKYGNKCIGSDSDIDFTFLLRNPKDFQLDMEFLLESSTTPNEYTVTQTDDKKVAAFSIPFSDLKTKELSGENLNGKITLKNHIYTYLEYSSFPVELRIDSVPPAVKNAMIQLTNASNGEYVLCFYLPVVNGTVHEKDTKTLKINNRTWYFSKDGKKIYTDIQCTAEDTQNFASSMTVYPLDDVGTGFNSSNCPEGYFPWFYKTGITESTQEHRFTVTIEDDAGFTSNANVSSQGYQLEPVTFEIESSANQFEAINENTSYNANSESATAKIRIVHSGKTVSSSAFPDGKDCGDVDVAYAVYSQSNTIDPNPYKTGKVKVSKDNPGIIELPYGENYYIKADVSKDYYLDSDTAIQKINEIKRNSNTYYVSSSGDTGNDTYYGLQKGGLGTRQKPFKSLQDVVADITNYNDSYSDYSINLLSNLTLGQTATSMMNNTLEKDITLNGNGYRIDGKNKCNSIIKNNPENSNSVLTLKNVTLTGGGIIGNENVYGSAINLDSGSVRLESGTVITGNISTYGAVYVSDNVNLYVSGKINITGNKYYEPGSDLSEQERNVYLGSDIYIYVDGSLAGSKIGVTIYAVPTVTEPITLTSQYSDDNYNLVPSTVFLSDNYYGITTNYSGEVIVALNGAEIEQPEQLYDVIKITPNRTVIEKAQTSSLYKQISFTIEKDTTNVSLDNFKVDVYCHGDLYKTYATTTITDFDSYPNDNYQLVVYGTYNGKVISNTFDIRVLDYVPVSEYDTPPNLNGSYYISSYADLKKVAEWYSTYDTSQLNVLNNPSIYLMNDIVVEDDFASIGPSIENPFRGFFYGNGKTISNLKVPLIAHGRSGVIQDVIIEGDISGSSAFVEVVDNGSDYFSIKNCINYANVSKDSDAVGAFCGKNLSTKSLSVENCTNYGNITNTSLTGSVSSIVGSNTRTTITECFNYGIIKKGNQIIAE